MDFGHSRAKCSARVVSDWNSAWVTAGLVTERIWSGNSLACGANRAKASSFPSGNCEAYMRIQMHVTSVLGLS
jgi:hypothetical protein